MTTQGYDKPIGSKGDLLNRGGFAKEIANLATDPPPDWSVRIGIYGGWGSGKSSVLNLVEEVIKGDGEHVVVRFNPWGSPNEAAMWEGLAKAVRAGIWRCSKLHTANLAVHSEKTRLAKVGSWLKKASMIGGPKTAVPVTGLVVAASAAGSLFNLKDALHAAMETLKDRDETRIVVLIDDLDRLKPSLIPPALFALREVLDTPGYSFVLALDPTIVAKSLHVQHPALGDGTLYLDKIVEFPRWVPEPTDQALKNLIHTDRTARSGTETEGWLGFFPKDTLDALFPLMPRNPRSLRRFLRNLWSLKIEVARYDEGELNWFTIGLTWLLADLSREVWKQVVEEGALKRELTAAELKELEGSGGEEAVERAAQCLRGKVVASAKLDELSAKRLDSILKALSRSSYDALRECAQLVERPPDLTSKEFREAIAGAAAWSDVEAKLTTLHQERGPTLSTMKSAAVSKLVRGYFDNTLGQAADERYATTHATLLCDAKRYLTLVEGAFELDYPECQTELADSARVFIIRALHSIHQDDELHKREQELSLSVCKTWVDPVALLQALEKWQRDRGGDETAHITNMVEISKQRCIRRIVERFHEDEHIFGVLISNDSDALLAHLIRDPAWKFWDSAEALLAEAETDPVVRTNLFYALESIAAEDQAIERSTLNKLWDAVTSEPVTKRFFREYVRLMNVLQIRLPTLETSEWLVQLIREESWVGESTNTLKASGSAPMGQVLVGSWSGEQIELVTDAPDTISDGDSIQFKFRPSEQILSGHGELAGNGKQVSLRVWILTNSRGNEARLQAMLDKATALICRV